MSEHRNDDPSQQPPTQGDKKAESPSADDFSYSRELTEKSAQRAFGEGMDAAGMALSLRALEEAEGHSTRPSPESFIKKILQEREAFSKQDAVSRVLEERAAQKNDGPIRR